MSPIKRNLDRSDLEEPLFHKLINDDPKFIIELVNDYFTPEDWETLELYLDMPFDNASDLYAALQDEESKEILLEVVNVLLEIESDELYEDLVEYYYE